MLRVLRGGSERGRPADGECKRGCSQGGVGGHCDPAAAGHRADTVGGQQRRHPERRVRGHWPHPAHQQPDPGNALLLLPCACSLCPVRRPPSETEIRMCFSLNSPLTSLQVPAHSALVQWPLSPPSCWLLWPPLGPRPAACPLPLPSLGISHTTATHLETFCQGLSVCPHPALRHRYSPGCFCCSGRADHSSRVPGLRL